MLIIFLGRQDWFGGKCLEWEDRDKNGKSLGEGETYSSSQLLRTAKQFHLLKNLKWVYLPEYVT